MIYDYYNLLIYLLKIKFKSFSFDYLKIKKNTKIICSIVQVEWSVLL